MIVVTGAAGFIGSNIVAALNARGQDDVIAADNPQMFRETGNLRGLRVQAELDKDNLHEWLEQNTASVEAIIHMGACSDTTQNDRAFMMANNFKYTCRLWNFCTRFGKRFVYASSAATYGDGSNGFDDRLDPAQLKPLNLYGESKQCFDLWALSRGSAPAAWAGLKFFNVYGPREAHKGRMASVAYHAFKQIRDSGHVTLFKSARADCPDGGQQRDFIYVKDAVAAVLHFVSAPIKDGQVVNGLFNVGTGKAHTFADLVNAIFTAVNLMPRIEYVEMPPDLKDRYQYFTQATVAKLRASGFVQPFHSLEDGVADYVKTLLF